MLSIVLLGFDRLHLLRGRIHAQITRGGFGMCQLGRTIDSRISCLYVSRDPGPGDRFLRESKEAEVEQLLYLLSLVAGPALYRYRR